MPKIHILCAALLAQGLRANSRQRPPRAQAVAYGNVGMELQIRSVFMLSPITGYERAAHSRGCAPVRVVQ